MYSVNTWSLCSFRLFTEFVAIWFSVFLAYSIDYHTSWLCSIVMGSKSTEVGSSGSLKMMSLNVKDSPPLAHLTLALYLCDSSGERNELTVILSLHLFLQLLHELWFVQSDWDRQGRWAGLCCLTREPPKTAPQCRQSLNCILRIILKYSFESFEQKSSTKTRHSSHSADDRVSLSVFRPPVHCFIC